MARFLIVALTAAIAAAPVHAGDLAAGQTYFHSHCSICHGDKAHSPPGVGPGLFGVVGRVAGTLPGYSFSKAMKTSHVKWTPETLKRFLANPQMLVHGDKMPFPGIRDAIERDNVVAYLQSLH